MSNMVLEATPPSEVTNKCEPMLVGILTVAHQPPASLPDHRNLEYLKNTQIEVVKEEQYPMLEKDSDGLLAAQVGNGKGSWDTLFPL